MRLLTWNISGRRSSLDLQSQFLAGRRPDIVTLQEVTPLTGPGLLELLALQAGLEHGQLSLPQGEHPLTKKRSLGVLIASRFPLAKPDTTIRCSWPEKSLSSQVTFSGGSLELHTVHVPPGSRNGWAKVDVLESVFGALARPAAKPRILTGDFNTPQAELEDGTVITWAQRINADGRPRKRGRIRGGPASRWDAAERNVLRGLGVFGFRDVYRFLHGYQRVGTSWILCNRCGEFRRRFDHVLATEDLKVLSAEYLAEPVDAKLSDHCPLEVVFGAPDFY